MFIHRIIGRSFAPAIIIILLLHFPMQVDAQLRFNSLTVNDGLSQHDVSSIIQDSHGFIWIGTYDGLNRYDGYRIENFFFSTRNHESISGNRILCLFEDSRKRMWVGTDGEGLNFYDLSSDQIFRVQTPDEYKVINDVSEDNEGNILVATANGVLKIIETSPVPTTELLQIPLTGMVVNKITPNSDGIFFATNNGIWKLQNQECKQIESTNQLDIDGLIADRNGLIWLSGPGGLLAYMEKVKDSYQLTRMDLNNEVHINSMAVSSDNTVWGGSMNNGLFKVNATEKYVEEIITADNKKYKTIFSNSIPSVYCDNSNTIWVANRQGVSFASLLPANFWQIPVDLTKNSSSHIQALLYDERHLYFGTQSGFCYRYNLESGETIPLDLPENIFPTNFFRFNDRIYLTSNLGIFYAEKEDLQFNLLLENFDGNFGDLPNVFSMTMDQFGNYYYGSYNGLIIQSKSHRDFAHNIYEQAELLRNKRVFTLHYDSLSQCVWVGTISEGIFKLNLADNGSLTSVEFYHSSMENGYHIDNNSIWCFFKDRQDNLWAGTDAGLLLKESGSNTFSHLMHPGIVDKKIMNIEEDHLGILWLTNSQGMISFDPIRLQAKKYSYKDGLSTSTFTEAIDIDEKGIIYVGSINGINAFNPAQIEQNGQANSVYFTDLKIHQSIAKPQESILGSTTLAKSINETSHIQITHKQNNFSFEYAGSHVAEAKDALFRYQLIGYDRDWIYTDGKLHMASYSNLKPGDYTFKVEAANKDGLWSNQTRTMGITILPAPWKTWWAYLIYILLVIVLLSSFIYFLYNRQKLQQKIHLDKLNRDKEHRINELKLEFFTDVAHEFKTPLSLIIGPLNDLIQNDLAEETKRFNFQVISKNTKRMMFLVNQLLDFRKINADVNILNVGKKDLSEFIHHTTRAFLWQAQNERIHFNIVAPEELKCYFDSNILEKVLYNIISNAFKHTPQGGIIELEVKSIWKDHLPVANIIVRDSGKGIPDPEKNKIFERFFHGKDRYSSGIGLHLSYTLMKAHKGEITVSDSNYGGAEFVLSFPVSKDNFAQEELLGEEKTQRWPEDNFKLKKGKPKPVAPERERILIVEDDHDLRAYLKNCLNTEYHISEASNGAIGVKLSRKELPDIIVSDVMMPEMDGMEMCRIIRETPETSHIPILLVTAKSDEEYQKAGLDCGAWDYITKPFNTQALLKKIENIFETRNRFKSFLTSQNITLDVKKHYTTFDQKLISNIIEKVQAHLDDPDYSVEDLASDIGLSRMQMHRKLKSLVGMTTTGFINSIRISRAKNLMDNGFDRIQEVMDAVGVSSYSHFTSIFKKIEGTTPSEYMKSVKKSLKLPPPKTAGRLH